jgi:hypothetical protein
LPLPQFSAKQGARAQQTPVRYQSIVVKDTGAEGSLDAGLLDSGDDQPADPTHTLSFTLDLTRCLDAKGLAFNPGDERGVDLEANPAAAIAGGKPPTAVTHLTFQRQ